MPLEPTEEQLETVVASVFDGGDWSVANEYERAEAFATARAYWPLIRDMVLEAAARECEDEARVNWEGVSEVAIGFCVKRIHAMKGTP